MISIITSILLIISLFLSEYLIEAIKRTIKLITAYSLKILSFLGIKIKIREKTLKVSEEFKETFKEIKAVKLSNKNLKEKPYIDYLNLTIFLVSLILIIVNLGFVSGNIISKFIFSLIKDTRIIKSFADINTLLTAVLYSTLSFSATKLLQRWKETKPRRIDNHNKRLKQKAVKIMTTKELLEEAKNKDLNNRKELE